MKQLTSLLAACAFLAACATRSFAQTETVYSGTIQPSTLTDWTSSFTFAQFNTALGTLNSVELQLTASLSTTLTVQNNALSSSSGNAYSEMYIYVDNATITIDPSSGADTTPGDIVNNTPGDNDMDGSGNGPNDYGEQIDALSSAFNYTLGLGGSAGPTVEGLNGDNNFQGRGGSAGVADLVYTAAQVLADFAGSGNVTLNTATFTDTFLQNTGGNTSATQTTDAGLTGTVIYNYTAVPEPSTFGLLALGLGALPFLRRKRQ